MLLMNQDAEEGGKSIEVHKDLRMIWLLLFHPGTVITSCGAITDQYELKPIQFSISGSVFSYCLSNWRCSHTQSVRMVNHGNYNTVRAWILLYP